MIEIIGYLGLALLVLSYYFLSQKKYVKYFLPTDVVASIFLTTYAILLKDTIVIITNIFITVMLIIKIKQGGLK